MPSTHTSTTGSAPDASLIDTPVDTVVGPTFTELGVDPQIVSSLARLGIDRAFAIQELTLPLALSGNDLIGQARTGTGKTYGFSIPLLHRIARDPAIPALDGTPRGLVIVPTRELCVQVTGDLTNAAKDVGVTDASGSTRPITIASIYGGRPMDAQIATLKSGADVVVGTPGRLLDLAQQGHLTLAHVRVAVLDEADEMLDLGFLPDIERLLGQVPDNRQTLLFSATMPGPIIALARRFLTQPTHIRAETGDDGSAVHATTAQFVYRAHALDKPELVAKILRAADRGATIIFARTKRTAQKIADDLDERGFSVGAVHGDLNQVAREKSLKRFRQGTINVLVATDVAARGIDIDNVTHVVNYQCPEDEKTFVHRIGRTGRAGRAGTAVTLVDWDELDRWKSIDSILNLGIPEPIETYSSSDHLFTDLKIAKDAVGRIARTRSGATDTRPSTDNNDTDGAIRGRRTRAPQRQRTRRRTRGGVATIRNAKNEPPSDNSQRAGTANDATPADSPTPTNHTPDTAESTTRRRTRRNRTRTRGGKQVPDAKS